MGEKLACGKTTQDLLLEFQQTGSQAPFEEIARRYAGMVYNVALQVTRDAHDAEDATQATFLTLAVHAKTAGKIRFVGPWLRKVSQRLALDIRRSKKRRTTREQRHAITRATINGNGNGDVSRHDLAIANSLQIEELRDILRNELDKLPTKYRMPLILYYFGGLTPDQIGKELKCKTSTLGVRLHRGRKMLADNLSARGIGINSATAGVMLAALVDSSIRDNLVHACTHAAVQVAARGFVADATVSAPMFAMVNGVTSALRISRLKGLIAAAVLAITTLTGTAAALERLQVISIDTLKNFNPLQLIRPMLDRMLRPGFLSLDVKPAVDPVLSAMPPDQLAALSTGMGLQGAGTTMWPAPPQFISGIDMHVGSARVMASRFELPVSSASPALSVPTYSVPALSTLQPQILASSTNEQVGDPVSRLIPMTAGISSTPIAPSAAPAAATIRTHDVLVIDRSSSAGMTIGNNAALVLNSGMLQARKIVVGDTTDGSFTQNGGSSVQADEAVVIGNRATSTGTYSINHESTLTTPSVVVGLAGSGTMIQSGGLVSAVTPEGTGNVIIGDRFESMGAYVLKGGSLVTDKLIVGRSGTGLMQQEGGLLTFAAAFVGQGTGGKGTWTLSGGAVQVTDGSMPAPVVGEPVPTTGEPVPTVAGGMPLVPMGGVPVPTTAQPVTGYTAPVITVGGSGAGTILLRASTDSVAIQESPGERGTAMIVRPTGDGSGVVRGWGRVELTGALITNGKVIADGFGTPQTLDFSSVSSVTNTIDNPPEGGTNGWYAVAGGSLKLPPVSVDGSKEYTWGEFKYDTEIDLVNSVRFNPLGEPSGVVDITLLDPLTDQVPLLGGRRHGLSLWEMDASFEVSGIELVVRYDDVLASLWRFSESDLALWVLDDGEWTVLSDATGGLDTQRNLIWATAGSLQYFAVGLRADNLAVLPTSAGPVVITPEPMGLATIGIVTAGALLRRRRR